MGRVRFTPEQIIGKLREAELFLDQGTSIGKAIRGWLGRIGVRTLFIEPGSHWENGYVE